MITVLYWLGVAAAVAGALITAYGARRASGGAALARAAATIEQQLTRPPGEVIALVRCGAEIARSGQRIARRGLALTVVGAGIALAATVVQLLT